MTGLFIHGYVNDVNGIFTGRKIEAAAGHVLAAAAVPKKRTWVGGRTCIYTYNSVMCTMSTEWRGAANGAEVGANDEAAESVELRCSA
jgi:hypothetical protein